MLIVKGGTEPTRCPILYYSLVRFPPRASQLRQEEVRSLPSA